MIEVIASLMGKEGQRKLAAIQASKKIWDDLLSDLDNMSVQDLAKQLQKAQMSRFEKECAGNPDGKYVMAYTAAAYYYDEFNGFEENKPKAKKLQAAIEQSSCSIEVKGAADQIFRERLD